jgi:Tfp pilus assembly protein PilF
MTEAQATSTLTAAIEHHRAGRHAQAEALYRQVLDQLPNHRDALHLLGVLTGERGQHEAALDLIGRAIAADPSVGAFHASLGETYRRMGNLESAQATLRKALAIDPTNAEAHSSLGLILQSQGQTDQAIIALVEAVNCRPDEANFHNSLGFLFSEISEYEKAIPAFRKSLALNPNQAHVLTSLGGCLTRLGLVAEAIDVCQKAIAINPQAAESYDNLGLCLCRRGQYAEAGAMYRRAIELRPDLEEAHSHLGTLHFLQGDLPRGFAEYEWRLKGKEPVISSSISQPRWDGKDLGGKTILLHAEQGFGDLIQMVRYIPLVAARHGRIVLNCYPELMRLFSDLPHVQQMVPVGAHAPPFDVYCPILSLPLVFGTTLLTIPAYTPYLFARPDLIQSWKQRLGPPDGRMRIGLAWAGRPQHENDRGRSIRLDQLAPLADISGASFFSLQKGPARAQIARSPFAGRMIDWTEELNDFVDTAALMANLDLVIAVDTAVAHLAGALARPVWVLLPHPPDWRWMLHRPDSPWYPTMRLFRQQQFNQWDPVIAELSQAMAREIGGHTASR